MKIESQAFEHNQPIPRKYTCEGADLSPPLSFDDIPLEAKSLALVVDDPDAPSGVFDHWIVWNLSPREKELPEGVELPLQGTNHFGEQRYRGPCPPRGAPHHYRFKLYALSVVLDLPVGSSKSKLEQAMSKYILTKAELIGTYQRK